MWIFCNGMAQKDGDHANDLDFSMRTSGETHMIKWHTMIGIIHLIFISMMTFNRTPMGVALKDRDHAITDLDF